MVQDRRAFNSYPAYLRTDQNDRETYIADDVMFEPERADFLIGYVGDPEPLTAEDLERTPLIAEDTPERQKYQLSIGTAYIDPETGNYLGGAFYQDLVRHLAANGAITDDPNRLFETPFYAWTPPIDYDKHVNFSRYFWVGPGAANVNGEYVTKEQSGSTVVLHQVHSGGVTPVLVELVNGLPGTGTVGQIVEDSSSNNRLIYRWDGSSWNSLDIVAVSDVPTNLSPYPVGTYLYVCRYGPDYQSPVLWRFSAPAGRWISQPVVVSLEEPDTPREGMVWEDPRILPYRRFRRYENGVWVAIVASPTMDLSTETQTDGRFVYDIRQRGAGDTWAVDNWWRHYEDLSSADRSALSNADQGVRPIVEFWGGIESIAGDAKDFRNESPQFQLYAYDSGAGQIDPVSGTSTTIYQYRIGAGQDDAVLGFPLSFNQTGEFQFELTLESQTVSGIQGYRYFRDTNTGLLHSVWAKSDVPTEQPVDADGLYDVPVSISSNPDHEVLTTASRSRFLTHFTNVIESQPTFDGTKFGLNNYRWTDKNPTVGATIIDCENTLLRVLGTLQSSALDIPDAIRGTAKDYNRVLFKFQNRLNQLFDDLTLGDPAGTLLVTPGEAVDKILSDLFVGRNEDFPYFYSDMGTFVETEVSGGSATVIDPDPRPIFIPPSAPRIGVSAAYEPGSFVDKDGNGFLQGHEGIVIPSFGDDRDQVWLELQNRFFNQVPTFFRQETNTFTTRFSSKNFFLKDYYGDLVPQTVTEPVDTVVADYNAVAAPTPERRVLSTGQAVVAIYDGAKWITQGLRVDDVVQALDTGEFHIYNGQSVVQIPRYNTPAQFDYTVDEFRRVIRREFERWVALRDDNYTDNEDYDPNDPFTWNYRSVGLEGHYLGIYLRVYRTTRPHSHPWEVLGYSIKPDWWDAQYPTVLTGPDGSPRWPDTDPMWNDLQAGIVNPITGDQRDAFVMNAPIPVDSAGQLIDPVASGLVNQADLIQQRLDDSWMFGDGSPVEQEFYQSAYWGFTVALASYLMKPGIWIDPSWSLLYIDIGENQLWRGPHVVHEDTLTRPKVADLPVHLTTDDDGNTVQRLGLQAWISERVRARGNDIDSGFARIIQNTTPTLGWKVAGFINQTRTVVSTLGGKRIPFEDIHPILHRSPPTETNFSSGMFVQREGDGYTVFGFDLFNPFFRVELPAISTVGGQVELRETFTAEEDQHTFELSEFTLPRTVVKGDTAKVAVLVNGLKIKEQFVTIVDASTVQIEGVVKINEGDAVSISTITAQSNSATRVKRFTVRGTPFEYYASGSGRFADIPYGRYFETSVDVINFMLAYGRAQEAAGWVFDYESERSGAIQDWMNGAKLFADWVLRTAPGTRGRNLTDYLDAQEGFLYSPVARQAKFQSGFGQILNIETLQNGAYGVVDDEALPVSPEDVFTSRVGPEVTLQATGDSDMYGVRIYQAEYQHVVFFSNQTRFNDTIYDPIIGQALETLRVDTYRSTGWTGRLEADGFAVRNDDILPNFEKQAFDITRYYDRIDTVDDPLKRDQARNLYGWAPNDSYMDAIGADDRSRFDYYRGMIKAKGTARANIAFNRGTRLGADNVVVSEDWAWKFCEFGDRRVDVVQFRVDKEDFRDEVQVIEFGGPETLDDNIIEVEQFNRSTPDADTRWIMPPILGQDDCCDYRFPVTPVGLPDTDRTRFYVEVFDNDTKLNVSRHFHFDPELDRYEPEAFCQIDYRTALDPARYNRGPGADYSANQYWGQEQVGQYWWDTDRLAYTAYRSQIPNYPVVAQEWGKLKYFDATITRTNEIVTVQTRDPYTGAKVPHELSTGDFVVISGAQQADYNGEIQITVTGPTEFEFQIDGQPASPATGDIQVRVAYVDIYEWVESPVPPTRWADYVRSLNEVGAPTGVVDDPENASYSEETRYENGVPTTVYYFWIRANGGANPLQSKEYTAQQVARRLSSPTAAGVPWFAPVNADHMLIHMGGTRVRDNYAVEVKQDQRELESHVEWILLSENDRFREIPETVRQKLFDSLVGQDEFGSPVPSPLLSPMERYGNDVFPPQNVFRDPAAAAEVFVSAINRVFQGRDLALVENLTGIFPLADEGTYWSRAAYRAEEYQGRGVYDVVADLAQRNDRQSKGFYAEGDLVTVKNSGLTDPWDGTGIEVTYALQNGLWIEVGRERSTVELSASIISQIDDFRRIYDELTDILSRAEVNSYVFSLLYEMVRQNPDCDWFFKTSYLSVQVFDTISTSPFVRPSEPDAVIANLLDTKAYRSKLRSETATLSLEQPEDMTVQIIEFPDQKYTLLFDRVACDLTEDGGWDAFPWDAELIGWDKPFWDFADLGRGEFYSLGQQSGNDIRTVFEFTPRYDPTLYLNEVVVRFQGEVIDAADQGIIVTYTETHDSITVETNFALTPQHTVEVVQAMGFYEGPVPTLGDTLEDTEFRPAPSSYEHAVARTLIPGQYNPADDMAGCPMGQPEERFQTEVDPSVVICVKTDYTSAYQGWDSTPWDTTGWDQGPDDIGRRVFLIAAGDTEVIPAGAAFFPTSDDRTVDANPVLVPYIVSQYPEYDIVQVQHNGMPLVEGVNYEFVEPFSHVIELLDIPDITYTADGATTGFDASAAVNGVQDVFLNGALLTDTVDYNVVGTDVEFVQPPPTVIQTFQFANTVSYEGDAATAEFDTGHDVASLNENNVFLFQDGDLVPTGDYTAGSGSQVVFNTPPALNDQILMLTQGNIVADSDPVFGIFTDTGDGATTTFVVGLNAREETSFVFVNGRYQILGTDYNIPVNGEIEFVVAPAPGDAIEVRTLDPATFLSYDYRHDVILASGTQFDPVPGQFDLDPRGLMVFIGDQIQDGYTTTGTPDYVINNGAPDEIEWVGAPPAAGTPITVRFVRISVINETNVINVLPNAGDDVRIVPNSLYADGDTITFVYNGWPVGPLGNFTVANTPGPYDIVDGKLALDTAIPAPNDLITINYTNARRGALARDILVRMSIIVDDLLADHLSYDGANGFETDRRIGTVIVNTTTNNYWRWDGMVWVDDGAVNPGDQFFVRRDLQIVEFDGANYNVLYNVGETYTSPPVLGFPAYGAGITYGTYALGQLADAATNFPEAYEVIQHPGDC